MAKSYKTKSQFPVPKERLLEVMTDPELRKAQSIEIEKALEAEATKESITATRLRLVTRSKVYSRGMDGKKDLSKTETATHTEEWDLQSLESTWRYRMEETFGDRVKVEGRRWLRAEGPQACSLEDEIKVEVNVPMIGNMIAGQVIASMERSHPKLIDWLRKRL